MKFSVMKKAFFFLSIFYFTLASSLSAQSFKVYPSSVEFKLAPGQSKSYDITVENTSDKEESFIVSTSDFAYNDRGDMKFFPAGTTKQSCSNYLTVSSSFLKLNPNSKTKVTVMMNLPEGVTNTTKWGLVSIRSEKEFTGQAADKSVVRAGLIITPEIAVKVLQTPPGLSAKKININDFIELQVTQADSNRVFLVKMSNDGEILTKFKVYLTLSNLETLEEQTIEPIDMALLPNVKSEKKLNLPKGVKPGTYSLAAILDYGDEYDLEGMEMEIEVK